MKKIVLFLFLTSSFIGFSQEDAWVYFKDKPNAATYLSNPLTMLTQRALDRRTNQGIALDINDVPVHQPYIDQITASAGITVKAKSKWLNCVHVRGLQTDINALSALIFVDHIQFADNTLNSNKRSKKQGFKPVNKVLETAINFNYGNSANQIQMLNGHLLHQQNYTGAGKIIAVLDAGFPGVNTAQPFQRLITNNLILGGYDFVNKSSNFYTGNSHGTLVLSTMGGFVDGQLVGTAPDASYYLFITEDVATENPVEESNWVEAAEEADRLGVDIITTSLGYFGYDNPAYSHTYSEMTGNATFISKGANIAFSRGIVVVASAGNEGATTEPHVGVPAEATNVLAIGAVKADETYAAFSSIGPSFDNRVKPDVMAQGDLAVVSNPAGSIGTASGTSFSGPILAGMIASFWQAVPWANNAAVIQFVKQSADRFTVPTIQVGYGIPDFQSALNAAYLNVDSYTKNDFVVYPNPTQNSISVLFPMSFDTAKISIYTILGQIILEEKIEKSFSKVSLERFAPGIYLYKIESNTTTQSGSIIKE